MKNRLLIDRRCFVRAAGMGLSTFLLPMCVLGGQSDTKQVVSILNSGTMTDCNGTYEPPYIALHKKGILKERASVLNSMMRQCTLCPRECKTDRLSGRRGDCNARDTLEISSVAPHFGEEPELVGRNGSGTIFFTNCSLLCVFCINFDISQHGRGQRRTVEYLVDSMLRLQERGCHNINLVTPSHYIPHIMSALDIAASKGLNLPIVYNTCGWEKLEILKLLDGVVDIYLADFKYFDSDAANTYSPGASSYPEITKKAILEMHKQVGLAKPDERNGLMNRGLMIRHLVMPNNVSSSDKIMQWIGTNLPSDTYVNIMSQYTPVHKASKYPMISRRIRKDEYQRVIDAAGRVGLTNVTVQGL